MKTFLFYLLLAYIFWLTYPDNMKNSTDGTPETSGFSIQKPLSVSQAAD